jgi:hypothetical protein
MFLKSRVVKGILRLVMQIAQKPPVNLVVFHENIQIA